MDKKSEVFSPASFFRGLVLELKNVEWPSRERVLKSSALVLLIVVVSVLFVLLSDYIWMNVFLYLKGVSHLG